MKGYLDQQVPFTFPQVSGGSAGRGVGRVWGVWAGRVPAQSPRTDPVHPQQPPGHAGPGCGAPEGAGKSPVEPGLPPVQDSEGKGGGGGEAGGGEGFWAGSRSSPCASAPTSPSRPASPPLEHPAVPPQRSTEEPSRFSCRPLPGLEPVPGDLADRR